jgi:hypothetical protein
MHRLRQALPYLREFGWDPVVFAVDPRRVEGARDELLAQTIPTDIEVRHVGALPAELTRIAGLGNLGFRSWFQLRAAVDDYLTRERADLIFFTTTVFASIAHGPHWKARFGVPFVVDLQDPWRNDYYLGLPKAQRPPKFWFDYWQKSRLEAATMPKADGLMAVSQAYIDTMQQRYPVLETAPSSVLPFAAAPADLEIARQLPPVLDVRPGAVRGVYVGRGGVDMARSLSILFSAMRDGLASNANAFGRLKLSFLGTSYAPDGRGAKTVMPVAAEYGVEGLVTESTDRLPYFRALRALLDADFLIVPGSDDPGYTASKIFPYIYAQKPVLAVFHAKSSAVDIIEGSRVGDVVTFSDGPELASVNRCRELLARVVNDGPKTPDVDLDFMQPYSAREMTRSMVRLFEQVS